jgi:hypothetical protein
MNLPYARKNKFEQPRMRRLKFPLLLWFALVIGLAAGWVDTRPTWDDTGVTVFFVLLTSALFGAVMPSRAWAFAFAVGGGVWGFNIVLAGNIGAGVVLIAAFVGAYGGVLLGKTFSFFRQKKK